MSIGNIDHSPQPTDRLHPLIYKCLAGLALWFVLSAWLFAGTGYSDLALGMVSVLVLIAVSIPFLIWQTWRRHRQAEARRGIGERFGDWAAHELDTWQGHQHARTAALEILLPIAAVAFGLTAFALVFHFVSQSLH